MLIKLLRLYILYQCIHSNCFDDLLSGNELNLEKVNNYAEIWCLFVYYDLISSESCFCLCFDQIICQKHLHPL